MWNKEVITLVDLAKNGIISLRLYCLVFSFFMSFVALGCANQHTSSLSQHPPTCPCLINSDGTHYPPNLSIEEVIKIAQNKAVANGGRLSESYIQSCQYNGEYWFIIFSRLPTASRCWGGCVSVTVDDKSHRAYFQGGL